MIWALVGTKVMDLLGHSSENFINLFVEICSVLTIILLFFVRYFNVTDYREPEDW